MSEGMEMIIQLMSASHNQSSATMWSLVRGLTISERKYRAQLAIVRDKISTLMNGPYMPNPGTVHNALIVSDDELSEWLAAHHDGEWSDPTTATKRCWSCWECSW